MDIGVRTPLLDFFRKGDVAHDVRLQAAQGALATRAHEQLALLVLLTGDPDPEIVAAAETTLGMIPAASLCLFPGADRCVGRDARLLREARCHTRRRSVAGG